MIVCVIKDLNQDRSNKNEKDGTDVENTFLDTTQLILCLGNADPGELGGWWYH